MGAAAAGARATRDDQRQSVLDTWPVGESTALDGGGLPDSSMVLGAVSAELL